MNTNVYSKKKVCKMPKHLNSFMSIFKVGCMFAI